MTKLIPMAPLLFEIANASCALEQNIHFMPAFREPGGQPQMPQGTHDREHPEGTEPGLVAITRHAGGMIEMSSFIPATELLRASPIDAPGGRPGDWDQVAAGHFTQGGQGSFVVAACEAEMAAWESGASEDTTIRRGPVFRYGMAAGQPAGILIMKSSDRGTKFHLAPGLEALASEHPMSVAVPQEQRCDPRTWLEGIVAFQRDTGTEVSGIALPHAAEAATISGIELGRMENIPHGTSCVCGDCCRRGFNHKVEAVFPRIPIEALMRKSERLDMALVTHGDSSVIVWAQSPGHVYRHAANAASLLAGRGKLVSPIHLAKDLVEDLVSADPDLDIQVGTGLLAARHGRSPGFLGAVRIQQPDGTIETIFHADGSHRNLVSSLGGLLQPRLPELGYGCDAHDFVEEARERENMKVVIRSQDRIDRMRHPHLAEAETELEHAP